MNLTQVDLNLLVALDALLRERNVTRAGDRIGLSQPAMSSALFRLRRLFEDELLVREGREYHLTSLGQELLGPVQEILQMIEETIEKKPVFNPAVDKRAFTIAASDHMTFLVLQPLFARLDEEARGVTLQIQPLTAPPNAMDADLIIGHETLRPDLQSQVLYRDRWACAIWRGNEEIGDYLTLEQYLSMPHLAYGAGVDQLTGLADRAASAVHPTRRVTVTAETFFLLPFLLKGTRMVAFVHEGLGRRLAALSDIRLVTPPFDVPTMAETMFWHPRFTSDPAHRWLREQIATAAAGV
jgi:DNA-binding transcriptional LysR family regulator